MRGRFYSNCRNEGSLELTLLVHVYQLSVSSYIVIRLGKLSTSSSLSATKDINLVLCHNINYTATQSGNCSAYPASELVHVLMTSSNKFKV